LERLKRRWIKAKLAKSKPEALIHMGQRWLLPAFRRAAQQSPAYAALLKEAGVDAASIKSIEDFTSRCPLLDKANTFKRFGIDQLLCNDIKREDLSSVLTSSGHGGGGFALGLSTRRQQRSSANLIDIGLEMAFDIDSRHTLLINCLPMGVTFNSNVVCVANVSVREDMACAIVKQAGNLFDQIILCADPLFLKRLCDHSQANDIDWSAHRVHVIVGEETFSETFRDYLAGVLHIDLDQAGSGLIGSSMGVGELGLNLFNETRETVALRRACIADPALMHRLTGVSLDHAPAPTFLCFNPLRTFVEVINTDAHGIGDLVVTVMDETVPVPLMRYLTGDRMQLLPQAALQELTGAVPNLKLPPAPIVVLHGRAKDRIVGGGHVDLFKQALYRFPDLARQLSGAHRISVQEDQIHWEVQAARDATADQQALAQRLHAELTARLSSQLLCVTVHDYTAFPYGMGIDYERKFVYWAPPT
jgi:phenylacetate-CoA ligase